MQKIDVRLPAVPSAVREARRVVDGLELPEEVADDIRLLVSEVVTNSVRHAQLEPSDHIALRATKDPGRVHVEVWDRGPGFDPRPKTRPETDRQGWGLLFLEEIADRWGVAQSDGICVWFEIDLDLAQAS